MLTDRQQQIWNYLVTYVDRHGYPPTVREIGEERSERLPRHRRCTRISRIWSAPVCSSAIPPSRGRSS